MAPTRAGFEAEGVREPSLEGGSLEIATGAVMVWPVLRAVREGGGSKQGGKNKICWRWQEPQESRRSWVLIGRDRSTKVVGPLFFAPLGRSGV